MKFKDFLNEKKITLKRHYTEKHPSVTAGMTAAVRNKMIEAVSDNRLTQEEFNTILSELSNDSKRWMTRNSKYFNVSEDGISLSKFGKRVLKTFTINENESFILEGTRSQIGILDRRGIIQSTYVHSDGYPEGVGQMAKDHFSDIKKMKELLKLGKHGISYLEPGIKGGPNHSFDSPVSGQTVFYGRDRGETTYDMTQKRSIKDIDGYLQDVANDGAEYVYLWDEKEKEWKYAISKTKDGRQLGLQVLESELVVDSVVEVSEKKYVAPKEWEADKNYQDEGSRFWATPFDELKSRQIGKPDFKGGKFKDVEVEQFFARLAGSCDGRLQSKILKGFDKYGDEYKQSGDNMETYKGWIINAMVRCGFMVEGVIQEHLIEEVEEVTENKLSPGSFSEFINSLNEGSYRVEYTTLDGEKAKSSIYNSKKEADKKEAKLVNSGIRKAKVVKVPKQINEIEKPTIVVYDGKRLAVDPKDIERLKSGKDIVGKSTKQAGQEEWISAKGKWEVVDEATVNETRFYAIFQSAKHEIEAKSLYDAKKKAVVMLKIKKKDLGLLAIVNADQHDDFSKGRNADYAFENEELTEAFKSAKLAQLFNTKLAKNWVSSPAKELPGAFYNMTKVALDKVEDEDIIDMSAEDAHATTRKDKSNRYVIFYIVDQEKVNPYAEYEGQTRVNSGILAIVKGNNFQGMAWGRNSRFTGRTLVNSEPLDSIGISKKYKGWDSTGLYNPKRISEVADRAIVLDISALRDKYSTAGKMADRAAAKKGAIAFKSDKDFKRENISRYKEILADKAAKLPLDKMVKDAIDVIAEQIKQGMAKNEIEDGSPIIGRDPKGRGVKIRDAANHMSNILSDYEDYVRYSNEVQSGLVGSGYYNERVKQEAKSIKDRIAKVEKMDYVW